MAFPPRNVPRPLPGPKLLNGNVPWKRRNRKASTPRSRVAPSPSIPPRRTSNLDRRTREYLTPAEVEKVLQASAKVGRHGARDRTLILLGYRHGLRVTELVTLRWDQVDLKAGLVHVNRLKNGLASTHPIRGPELRALRELRRDYPDTPYLFVTERGGPMRGDLKKGAITYVKARRPLIPLSEPAAGA